MVVFPPSPPLLLDDALSDDRGDHSNHGHHVHNPVRPIIDAFSGLGQGQGLGRRLEQGLGSGQGQGPGQGLEAGPEPGAGPLSREQVEDMVLHHHADVILSWNTGYHLSHPLGT